MPWIAILDDRITDTTRHGIYCVYLFRKDMTGAYLSIHQGVTELKRAHDNQDAYAILRERADALRERFPKMRQAGFALNNPLDVREDGLGADYEVSAIAHKFYPLDNIPSNEALLLDLESILSAYADYAEHSQPMSDLKKKWREHVTNLTQNQENPHKPLLMLLILAQSQQRPSRHFPYELVEERIGEALKFVGQKRISPQYPYWYMQSEGFWDFGEYDESPSRPKISWLREHDAHVEEDLWETLVRDEPFVLELVDLVLNTYSCFQPDQYAGLREFFGFPPEETDITQGDLPEPVVDLARTVDDFAEELQRCSITFGDKEHHTDFVRTFLTSLATKRFVILTGLSGSGKTQIALKFGQWLGEERYRIVPVRPDWTGAEALFGYEDALTEPKDGRRGWAVPEALEFMLEARDHPEHPYLLILDEMNLAHVERYFADALSGMETAEPVLPNLHREDDGVWRIPEGEAPKTQLPSNLFIVGTVNVDETTYMFSPKVLDRANTIEFRVRTEDLGAHRAPPTACASGEDALIRGFLKISRDDEWYAAHQGDIDLADFERHLKDVHRLLTEAGFEFGHRVFFEALRFATLFAHSGGEVVPGALDRQIMQKVLPRLHGSRRRLEATLCALAEFCHDPQPPTEGTILDGSATSFDPLEHPLQEAELQFSFEKLQRMTRTLRANQFVSFTE